jgi:hypothetical protein
LRASSAGRFTSTTASVAIAPKPATANSAQPIAHPAGPLTRARPGSAAPRVANQTANARMAAPPTLGVGPASA